MANPGWPDDFDDVKAGVGCQICSQHRGVDDNPYGPLISTGEPSDAFLQRRGFGAPTGDPTLAHRLRSRWRSQRYQNDTQPLFSTSYGRITTFTFRSRPTTA